MIGVVCFAVILANWFGGVRYFGGVPGGLVAIAVGTVIAWVSTALGLGYGDMSLANSGVVGGELRLLRADASRSCYTFGGFQVSRRDSGHCDPVRHL